jgi:hypothetical protein
METEILNEIGKDNYYRLRKEIAEKYSYDESDVLKSIEVVSDFVKLIYQNSLKIKILEDIIDKISALGRKYIPISKKMTPVAAAQPRSGPTHDSVAATQPCSEPTHASVATAQPRSEPTHTSVAAAQPRSEPTHTSVAAAQPRSEPTHTSVAAAQPHAESIPSSNVAVQSNHINLIKKTSRSKISKKTEEN